MKEKVTTYAWYQTLAKPSWAPSSWVFGHVWTVLYIIIAVSFGTVFYRAVVGQLPLPLVLPFVLNIIFNALFTPLQFGLKSNALAALDILLVLATLVWLMLWTYPYLPWVALANIPYLLWVCFATVLQLTIAYLNRNHA